MAAAAAITRRIAEPAPAADAGIIAEPAASASRQAPTISSFAWRRSSGAASAPDSAMCVVSR